MIAEIKFACAHCGQRIAVGSEAAGMGIDCPTCQNPVTIPHSLGISEPPRIGGGLREKLAALQSECERLRANATSSQAEIKSFQTERLALRNEVAALKRRAAAAEAQFADTQILRQRLDATETQLASVEKERAESIAALASTDAKRAKALQEMAGLRSELAAAVAASERAQTEAAGARSRFAEAETEIVEARGALATAKSELASLQTRFAAATDETESLRGLLDREGASRELLSMRTKLTAAEDELRTRRQSAGQLEADLKKAEADRARLDEERLALHSRIAEALKRADALSKDRLNADNEKLRELLERQNEELKLRFRELTRFRRAKLTLKIIWAVAALAMVGLGYFFVKILPTIEWTH